MCGIAGFHRPGAGPGEQAVLDEMLARLVHRGPDANGVHRSGDMFLGHRRLSIVDLSTQGNQPMFNEDGSISIVYNGELYDYHELRSDLESKGHRFRSTTDTEVILHLYEERGVECVEELRGMFAFALHDSRRERVLLARDRLGIKPLYWSRAGGGLSFASELRALLACPWIPRDVDPHALSRYLCFFYVPSPLSMLRDVSILAPGQRLVYERGAARLETYWSAAECLERPPDPHYARAEFEEELDALLSDTVRIHLNADVPVGAFLSGGVDSSGIVAHMSRYVDRAQTFCLTHENPDFDERGYAARVAGLFGTDHVEVGVHGGESFDVSLLDFLVDAYGEPMASPSAIAVHSVIQAMKGRVKCVLSGDGADEIFGGYPHYGWIERIQRIQRVVPPAIGRPLQALAPLLRFRQGRRIARLLERSTWTLFDFLVHEKGYFGFEEQAGLLAPDLVDGLDLEREVFYLREKLGLAGDAPSFANLYRFMVLQQLADDMLTKVDRASMGHSVEVRVPYVDHRLFELFSRAPAAEKFDPSEPKPLLKRTLSRHLPDDILYREKKGFAVHLEDFVGPKFWEHFRDLIALPVASEFFDRSELERVAAELQHPGLTPPERVRSMYRVWTLAVFLHWHQRLL